MGAAANRVGANDFVANVCRLRGKFRLRVQDGPRRADALNARGVRTARGGAWHNSTVRNLLARA
jgi:hypothetical protein